MLQKLAKSAAELKSMITAELREHPECESAGVAVISPTGGCQLGCRPNPRGLTNQ